MRIALDGMGGDNAPEQIIQGAALAMGELGVEVTVVGLPEQIEPHLKHYSGLKFLPASQVVGMDEHPSSAVRSKPDSSMAVCARLVQEGKAEAWVSAGNSGAVMATGLLVQGRIRGVERPALGSILPTLEQPCYFLDIGANVDSKPEYLIQFARMGSLFSSQVMGRNRPRVALLANAEEDGKGNQLLRAVNQRLREQGDGLNFIGNIEPQAMVHG
ncbi:MAG: phosphate acyltransferase, partial [Candidatus Dormibacteraceae bacterium]